MGLVDLMAGRPAATPHTEALARAEHGVTVYWRPGCMFCDRLRISVRSRRGVNGGNETVPTVVIDGTAHTNPAPAVVKAALAAH